MVYWLIDFIDWLDWLIDWLVDLIGSLWDLSFRCCGCSSSMRRESCTVDIRRREGILCSLILSEGEKKNMSAIDADCDCGDCGLLAVDEHRDLYRCSSCTISYWAFWECLKPFFLCTAHCVFRIVAFEFFCVPRFFYRFCSPSAFYAPLGLECLFLPCCWF